MLNDLKKKFIVLTTFISIVALILIFTTINIVNYITTMNNVDSVINLIFENDFELNSNFVPPTNNHFTQEVAFTTRYFILQTNENLNVIYNNTKNINYITPDSALIYLEEAQSLNLDKGTIGNFRYIKVDNTYVFLDIEEELNSISSYLNYSIFVSLGAIGVIFILSLLFAKSAVSPIADSYEKQKRFITDVSHELKTPLSIIKSNKELIEINTGSTDSTESINKQVNKLNSLINDLITLNKFNEENIQTKKTFFLLDDILKQVVDEFEPSLKEKNLTIKFNSSDNINFEGDLIAIKQLFSILIENSIKYSIENKDIVINLIKKNNKTLFTIQNYSNSSSINNCNKWFDRFYREDYSRNSESNGFGIGLSIAKSICQNHKAKITASNIKDNIVVIKVIF